jgi:glycolate oxidase FAD binding subunit
MVNQASLVSHLEAIVGSEGVSPSEELSAFAVDGLTPLVAVAPSTYEQVAQVARCAHAEGLAVIPWGGGTHMHIGNVPSRYDIALSLSRLDRVVEHEPADLTVTCQAGIALDRLRGHLGKHGQFVPLDALWGDEATVGGILSANASGPSRHAYGAPRDFTIGLRVVIADGRVTKAGGRVVKNVAGYDLCKLYIGSLGTLGIIVEATFKLAPLPRAEHTITAAFRTPAHACAFARELRPRGLALRAVQLLNPAAASLARQATASPAPDGLSTLLLDLAGTPQAIERSRREIGDLARGAAADLSDAKDTTELSESICRLCSPAGASLLCKAMVLPTQLPSLIDSLEAVSGPPRILGLPTIGVLYASWPHLDNPEEAIGRLRAATSAVGGSLVIEVCPLDLKRRLDVFPDVSGPSFDLMRRIKQQFDPQGILSPGRHLGRL